MTNRLPCKQTSWNNPEPTFQEMETCYSWFMATVVEHFTVDVFTQFESLLVRYDAGLWIAKLQHEALEVEYTFMADTSETLLELVKGGVGEFRDRVIRAIEEEIKWEQ